MTKNEIVALLKYDAWAIANLLTAVEKLDPRQYEHDTKSNLIGVQGTLSHIYSVQRMWLARWTGKGEGTLPEVLLAQDKLRERWSALQAELLEFALGLSDEKLFATFKYKDLRGNPYVQPLWQQLQHIVNHSTYYRGQITVMLRQSGVTTVHTDLIVYYRQH